MDLFERNPEPELATRGVGEEEVADDADDAGPEQPSIWLSPRRLATLAAIILIPLAILALGAFYGARYWLRDAAKASLPQVDGTLSIGGLSAPVQVGRDAHGVPHIRAQSIDDLLVAQGFVTASDRLFQMDLLRRHAAGELAEVLGPSQLSHDRMQRTLRIRASAERALATLPPDQMHQLERYSDGVNAAIAAMTVPKHEHLPIEFRILRYRPAKWTPIDSLLVGLSLFQDLTNTFPAKLARESLMARLPPEQQAELAADLYPVGSWRDHPPTSPVPDLTVPGPQFEDIPLDESQAQLEAPKMPTAAGLASSIDGWLSGTEARVQTCDSCTPGSNNWVVSGAHTASGKPLLSNDMHLTHTLPGIWYEADLETRDFHVAGVNVPGLPLILVGHNQHVAWGFTNLGADVQDVYVETLRGVGERQQFLATDGSWQPVVHEAETINVRGSKAVGFDVAMTRHGDALTPILNQAVMPAAAVHAHVLSLRWTIYDPNVLSLPMLAIDSASDWASFLAAFSTFGGPSQNVVYADDQGHIGYHAVGKIPLRGAPVNPQSVGVPGDLAAPVATPESGAPLGSQDANPLAQPGVIASSAPVVAQLSGPISPMPFVATVAREWTGYIPFDRLPQILDPAGGVIATANARTTPDDYPYPVALNWASPYRNERIWHLLSHRTGMTAGDMLPIQMDVYSDLDHVLAQRLAYALDNSLAHPDKSLNAAQTATLKQAADLLRSFDGRMRNDSSAAAIVSSVRAVLWPMLIEPHMVSIPGRTPASQATVNPLKEVESLYLWGEKDYALEQVLAHMPARWLPKTYTTWNDFLTAAVRSGLVNAQAPSDLSKWRYGAIHTLDIEHPIFDQSPTLSYVYGLRTGTGTVAQSGDGTTIKQAGHLFGPSERFTADLGDLDRSTLNLVTGESGDPISEWFLDQFPAWYHGTTFAMPFSDAAATAATKHTLTLTPAGK